MVKGLAGLWAGNFLPLLIALFAFFGAATARGSHVLIEVGGREIKRAGDRQWRHPM